MKKPMTLKALMTGTLFSLLTVTAQAANVHCSVSSSSENLPTTAFTILVSDGRIQTESFDYKNWSFQYGQGINKNSLSILKDGKPAFQVISYDELRAVVVLDPNSSSSDLRTIDIYCAE